MWSGLVTSLIGPTSKITSGSRVMDFAYLWNVHELRYLIKHIKIPLENIEATQRG